jgi:hypothetical protein
MESPYLNSPSPENDELETQLRTHLSVTTLPDNGFSERVLAALPTVENRSLKLRRQLFCAAGLIAGIVVATSTLIPSDDSSPQISSLIDALAGAGMQLFAPPVALALGAAALSLWFAFRGRLSLLPRL